MNRHALTTAGVLAAVAQFACAQGATSTEPEGQIPIIEVSLRIVQFPKKTIEALSRTNAIDQASILALYSEGEGELISAPVVRARPGSEASVRGVVEYIYPTSFADYPSGQPAGVTNELAQSRTGQLTNTVAETVVVPQDFATREVGAILTVMPELSPNRQLVHLTLTPNQVFPPTWKDYGIRKVSGALTGRTCEQPFFPVFTFTTQITMVPDTTALLAGGTPNADGTKMIYALVTVKVSEVEGKPVPK